MAPQDLLDFLVKLKGRTEMVLAYGVLIPTGTSSPTCAQDSGDPKRIEEFLSLVSNAGDNIYELCNSDFGNKLAKLGEDMMKRVGNIIYLRRAPIVSTIRVNYGTQEIPPHPTEGWSFNPEKNAIVLSRDIAWTIQPQGTTVKVYYEVAEVE
jgi:hypothetical protein